MAAFPDNAAFGGAKSYLNITGTQLVVGQNARCVRVSVIVASTAAGGIYDSNVTTGLTTANQIANIPASTVAGTIFLLDWQCQAGIVASPGTGGVLAVSYGG